MRLLIETYLRTTIENIWQSGRELFLTDTTLNDSDVKFLAETGDSEAVTVDESLFEDLDDLDLEDSDDPDFCPDGDESD